MTIAGPIRTAALLATLAAAVGCAGVNRRFVIESNVPNAQVYIDNTPVGPAPAHAQFEYYGHYTIKLIHPDYEPQTKRVHVVAPWYAYPPFDFLASFWPFGVEDVRRYYFELCKATPARTDQLLSNAEALRERGLALPIPAQPAGGSGPAPPPLPAPPVPGPAPLAPSPVPGVGPSGYGPRVGNSFIK